MPSTTKRGQRRPPLPPMSIGHGQLQASHRAVRIHWITGRGAQSSYFRTARMAVSRHTLSLIALPEADQRLQVKTIFRRRRRE